MNNKAEERTELVDSMEDNTKVLDYGSTEECKRNFVSAETSVSESHGHSCSLNMKSTEQKSLEDDRYQNHVSSLSKTDCLCTANDGICDCGQKKKGIELQPWSPIKSYALFASVAVLGLWILVIASLGAKNML